jgi:hypothetical protein
VALLIGFDSSPRRAVPQLEDWPVLYPNQAAFWLPDEARSGDRVLYYIGGSLASFVAIGRVSSDWKRSRTGPWKGETFVEVPVPRRLAPFVTGQEVADACGLPIPRDAGVVPRRLAKDVLAVLSGKPLDNFDRAIEGVGTESRSKQRNAKLRKLARERADDKCEACDRDFSLLADGLGSRCLVVHHKRQIRDYDEPRETRLSELAVVCANCHMMIHSDPTKALTVAQLRRKLRS